MYLVTITYIVSLPMSREINLGRIKFLLIFEKEDKSNGTNRSNFIMILL